MKKTNLLAAIVLCIVAGLMWYSFWIGSAYNNLVDLDENVNLAAADVQTMMQRRLELIPDLVEVTKAAAEHEEKVYEDIANARAALNTSIDSGNMTDMDYANEQLTTAINKLLVVVENYPTLTASEQYTSLMDQLEGSVNRISITREDYNLAVSAYNKAVRRVPGSIIASIFGFEEKEMFTANEEANDTNMVDFG